jgi:hypothetical protein
MKLAYKTQEVLDLLEISQPTLAKYRKLLGIKPRRKTGSRFRYYLWDDIQRMLQFKYPPEDLYSRKLDERLDKMMRLAEK